MGEFIEMRKALMQEMAKPSSNIKNKKYYHGTNSEESGESILKDGINPPDLSLIRGSLRPVDGMVYITPNFRYASIYANLNKEYGSLRDNGIGYIFEIEGNDLVDVLPDEDTLGESIRKYYQEGLDGISKDLKGYLESSEFENLLKNVYPDEEEPHDTDSRYYESDYERWEDLINTDYFEIMTTKFGHGDDYDIFALLGKYLKTVLPDWVMLEFIELGGHIAHKGSLKPSRAWKMEKHKSGEWDGETLESFEKFSTRVL